MGVTDVHSVPVPMRLRTYVPIHYPRTKYVGVMGVAAACDTSNERPPLFYDHFCRNKRPFLACSKTR